MIGTHFTQPPTEQEAIAVVEAVRRELQPVSLKFQILGFMLLFGALGMYVLIGLPQRPHLLPLMASMGLGLAIAIYLACPGHSIFLFNCSGLLHACFASFAFRFLSDGIPNQDFWIIPLCLLMTFTSAIVSSGFVRHLAYSLICWSILTRMGSVYSGAPGQEPLLVMLMVASIVLASLVCLFVDKTRRRNALLTLRLERLANSDALTGMPNRRSFLEAVTAAVAPEGEGSGTTHRFALLDIDNFKRINDTLGHGAGDAVLQRVGQAILAQCGPRPCGRMGGEEFGILLSGMDDAQAGAFLDALLAALRQPSGDGPPITASVGIAAQQRGDTLSETIRRADEALYAAKRAGKDRWQAAATGTAPAAGTATNPGTAPAVP